MLLQIYLQLLLTTVALDIIHLELEELLVICLTMLPDISCLV